MERFHINNKGNPYRCAAKLGRCPFATDDEHYSTLEEARAAYEESKENVPMAFTQKEAREGALKGEELKNLFVKGSAQERNGTRIYLRLLKHADYDMLKHYRGRASDGRVLQAAVQLHQATYDIAHKEVAVRLAQKRAREAKTPEQRKSYLKTQGMEQGKLDDARRRQGQAQAAVDALTQEYEQKLAESSKARGVLSSLGDGEASGRLTKGEGYERLALQVKQDEESGLSSRVASTIAHLSSSDNDSLVAATRAYGNPRYSNEADNLRNRTLELAETRSRLAKAEERLARSTKEEESANLRTEIARLEAKEEAAQLSHSASQRKLAYFRDEVQDTLALLQERRGDLALFEKLSV